MLNITSIIYNIRYLRYLENNKPGSCNHLYYSAETGHNAQQKMRPFQEKWRAQKSAVNFGILTRVEQSYAWWQQHMTLTPTILELLSLTQDKFCGKTYLKHELHKHLLTIRTSPCILRHIQTGGCSISNQHQSQEMVMNAGKVKFLAGQTSQHCHASLQNMPKGKFIKLTLEVVHQTGEIRQLVWNGL